MKNNYKEVEQLATSKGFKLVKSEELGNRSRPYYLYTLYSNNSELYSSELLKDIVEFIMSEELEESEETEKINTLDFGEINVFESTEAYESTADAIDLIKSEIEINSESGMIELNDGAYVQPYVTFRGEVVGIIVG